MDIRTKLALALIAVALSSMLLLGTFAYRLSANLLQEISERQLDALAEAKKRDLQGLVDGWRNDVRLIRSRTQLRRRLRDLQDNNDTTALTDMKEIIEDALESASDLSSITVFDKAGKPVVTVGETSMQLDISTELDDDEVRYAGFYIDTRPHVIFDSLVSLDNEMIGGLQVVIETADLDELASNYRGLGETGETIIFARNKDHRFVLLHELRYPGTPPNWNSPPEFVSAAANGIEQLITQDVYDFRNQLVWVATRSLPELDWGLVVKIDAEEETTRARGLRDKLIDLGLALGAFAVVGGTLLGFYLARPIRELASVIQRVHDGETELRANANSEDEIGLLAATLNNYLDEYGPDHPRPDDDDRTT